MKKEINYTNFEAFYLDLFEGNLSETDRNELLLFLENNPSLKTTLNDLDFHVKTNSHEKYPEQLKGNLYQFSEEDSPINTSSLSFFQAAHIDGILSKEKQKELELVEKSNVTFSQSGEFFALTKLAPDLTIVFYDKIKLKKRNSKLLPLNRLIYALAAACVLGFIIYKYKNTEQIMDSRIHQVAKSSSIQNKNSKKSVDTINSSNSMLTKELVKVANHMKVFYSIQSTENQKNQIMSEQVEKKLIIVDTILEKLRIESKDIKQQEEFTFNIKEELPTQAESVTENEVVTDKKFSFFNKLATKIFHRNVRIGKKSRLKSDEYYLVIGSFQVSRNISK